MPFTIAIESRMEPSGFFGRAPDVVQEDLRRPEAEDEPPGPAASWTTRASIAIWTGWRVYGEMIPQPIVSRFVSRAISAETTVEPRASI